MGYDYNKPPPANNNNTSIFNSKNAGLFVQGVGALAGAWGKYETDKERNKLARESLAYEKEKDLKANAKYEAAQSNLDDAFENSTLNKKKKKYDANGNEILEDTSVVV